MRVGAALDRLVRERAQSRCEYCRMHQSLQGATFHVEHIIPLVAGGETNPGNLALACPGCNLKKADHQTAISPESGACVPVFNPRENQWNDHFAWNGYWVEPESAIGAATIDWLELNQPRRLLIREAESHFGLYPP
ncbi:MAG: HNH endonuclease signature motif containing protein [Planctomycetota bacterium]|nr:HNH endonuclease signature motif containing protein [Planctomycetota bacterium]